MKKLYDILNNIGDNPVVIHKGDTCGVGTRKTQEMHRFSCEELGFWIKGNSVVFFDEAYDGGDSFTIEDISKVRVSKRKTYGSLGIGNKGYGQFTTILIGDYYLKYIA